VLVAKLAMVELAGGMGYDHPNASLTGPGLSPWNPSAWSGGSSSGSGSAVGVRAVPFAIGSETHGSILTPAAFCGISGLRPTYGRVSRHGAMALCWTLDKLGPMCRTADDCGLVLAAIAGADRRDPSASGRRYRYDPERDRAGGFRLGVIAGATDDAQPEVRQNFEASLAVLREFATLEEVSLPDLPHQAVAVTIIRAEASAAFDDFIQSGGPAGLTAEADRVTPYAYDAVSARDYLRAMRIRRQICRAMDALCARYDALVAPTLLNVAPPADESFVSIFRRRGPQIGGAGNVAGLPAISVPNGVGERGLPTAIQFVGRAWEENRVLAVARAFQQRTDWHLRLPPVLAAAG
jgi:aspartyl-tRNA(Asn)/glutamyl-tRNA(Gln) amidotransferase subunit A